MDLDADPEIASSRLAALPEGHPGRPLLLCELSWALRMTEPSRALQLSEQALQEAEPLNDRRAEGWARRNIGFFGMFLPEVRQALGHAHRAHELFKECGDELGQASSADLLATVYEVVGDYGVAMEYAVLALELNQKLGYKRGIGWAKSSIGGILAASGDASGAQQALEEALELFEALGYPLGIGRICSRLANLHLSQGGHDIARVYLDRLTQTWERLERPFFHAGLLMQVGELHEALGELTQAEEAYCRAVDLVPEALRRAPGAKHDLCLGRIWLKLGYLERARERLEGVAESARETGAAPLESASRQLLATALEQLGQPSLALQHFRRYIELRERELGAEARTKLRHLEVRMEVATARKDAEIHRLRYVELEQAQTQLVEAEKMAVLGRLAAGVAHELNSPLGVIKSSLATSERALQRLSISREAGEDARSTLDALRRAWVSNAQAVERIGEIVGSLKRFAHLDEAEEQLIDVAAELRGALTLLSPSLPAGVHIQQFLADVPRVRGHAAQLNQAFLTLLQNAVEAVEPQGSIRVATAPNRDRVVVEIADDGRGMSPTEMEHIFEARFSKGGDRVRFSLGLSAASATAKRHGGSLEVSSVPLHGTTFVMNLPVARG